MTSDGSPALIVKLMPSAPEWIGAAAADVSAGTGVGAGMPSLVRWTVTDYGLRLLAFLVEEGSTAHATARVADPPQWGENEETKMAENPRPAPPQPRPAPQPVHNPPGDKINKGQKKPR